MADTFYVDPTQPDGTGINPVILPENASDSPALPYLNSLRATQYEYQFWCGNVYHTLATNGARHPRQPAVLRRDHARRAAIVPEPQAAACSGTRGTGTIDFPPQGYLFQYDALEPPETGYLYELPHQWRTPVDGQPGLDH